MCSVLSDSTRVNPKFKDRCDLKLSCILISLYSALVRSILAMLPAIVPICGYYGRLSGSTVVEFTFAVLMALGGAALMFTSVILLIRITTGFGFTNDVYVYAVFIVVAVTILHAIIYLILYYETELRNTCQFEGLGHMHATGRPLKYFLFATLGTPEGLLISSLVFFTVEGILSIYLAIVVNSYTGEESPTIYDDD